MMSIFEDADTISEYSRKQAIEDGVLVDLSAGELGKLTREAGFKYPLACTIEVFGECVDLTPAAREAGNDIHGRLWDVLWMLRNAIRRSPGGDSIAFQVSVVRAQRRPTRTTLKCVVGPGDNAEPVMTIMFPEQD